MSLEGINLKRVRRTWEPTTKSWDDRALKTPWEDMDPPLDNATVFALKNVFFFSHATPIQYLSIKSFSSNRQSAIIEAPTGSGKTLGFLIPLMERMVQSAREYVVKHERPPLNRDVVGIILSPSRTLADQTFIVAKQLAARYPFHIQFLLCDGVAEKAEGVMRRLLNGSRGAGSFIVTTPHDLKSLLPLFQTTELDAFSKDTADLSQQTGDTAHGKRTERAEKVHLRATEGAHFLLIVDEADLTLHSTTTREIIAETLQLVEGPSPDVGKAERAPRRKVSKGTKKSDVPPLAVDFAFVGATVSTSPTVHQYAEELSAKCSTQLAVVSDSRDSDYLLQLENRYLACDAQSFLSVLVQLINTHASKKHFNLFQQCSGASLCSATVCTASRGGASCSFCEVYLFHVRRHVRGHAHGSV
ncbi:helicase [Strigomonas culicis]|uniref:ATP-dependent RNA helicase n=1 Tax=Strigomonas culicis TaxID=28005 RepID=S9VC55_9TRYP|nr:helicase [Strigomonas culicis]|eukprot:EPY20595.1 helicase [Strigomonas culicis]